MKKEIPAPVIAVISQNLPDIETHASLDNLFLYADAPGEPPEGSKPVKVQAWLRRINKESNYPLKVLGKLIETHMELPEQDVQEQLVWGHNVTNLKKEFKEKLVSILTKCNLTYTTGGNISDGSAAPCKALSELIQGRDIPSIEAEFNRAHRECQF